MVQPRFSLLLVLGNTLLLAGCSGAGGYPSLAARPVELMGDAAPPPAQAAPAEVDSALAGQIAQHLTNLADARRRFDQAADSARATITTAKGAQPGTRPWLAAQTALGQLDDNLGATRGVAGGIDSLMIDRAASGLGVPDALSQADVAAQEEVKRQAGIIDNLSTAIAAP